MTPANQWSIIHNWRKVGTMADEGTDDSSKEPRTTSKDLRVPLALVKVYDSEITKKLCKNGMHGRLPGWKTVETKESTGSSGICWRDKCRAWEGGRAIASGVKHSISLKIMAAIKQQWLRDELWLLCCFRTWTTCWTWSNQELCSLLERLI